MSSDEISAPTEPADSTPAAAIEPDGESTGSRIAGVATTIADAAGPVLSAALTPMRSIASGANRIIGERPGKRVRRIRQMGHHDLPNLWELYPEARRASIRELGLQSVGVDQIKGTAVQGPPQRGGDFLPLKARRSDDWKGRWQRILGAIDRLESLPPVELIKFGDGYWVVDGHNRVAAALYNGQVELDAVVEELRLAGRTTPRSEHAPMIAGVLEGSLDLRAAGSGRLTRTASRPDDLEGAQRARELKDELAARDESEAEHEAESAGTDSETSL